MELRHHIHTMRLLRKKCLTIMALHESPCESTELAQARANLAAMSGVTCLVLRRPEISSDRQRPHRS
eukprot:15464825-Alexandrium_andersonii.AAC.1